MKWVTGFVILLGSRLVSALPPPSPFVLQQPGSISDAGLNSVQVDNDESQAILPHLNAQDFHSIEAVKQSIEHGAVSILDRILNQVKKIMTKSNEATDGFEITAIEDTVESLPPRHPPVVIDLSHLTILEIVNASLGHHGKCGHSEASAPSTFEDRLTHDPKHLPLHRLAWIVNRTTEAHKLLEKDGITFLAPDDDALTAPHRGPRRGRGRGRGPHRHSEAEPEYVDTAQDAELQDAREHPLHSERILSAIDEGGKWSEVQGSEDDDDDKDRERRREIIHKIITYILSYHTIPSVEDGRELADKATLATELESSRIKVQPAWAVFPHPYPTIKFNGYAYKRGPTIKAKNGIIHLIGAPLFPPLSPLNGIFMFPSATSTFTSDLQRLGLTDGLLPETPHESADDMDEVHHMAEEMLKEHGKDAKTYTLFVPGNFAFNRLPPKILAFLHSPFPLSKRILSYVLKYHIVPDIAFFSDFVRNDTAKAAEFITEEQTDVEVPVNWLSQEDTDFFHFELLNEEQNFIKAQSVERPDGIPLPPRPRFPRPNFPRRPPGPPGHDPDHEHGPPPHAPPHPPPPPHHGHETHRANVTHYRLPTLLSVSGENPNATLPVAVVKYRFLGKGPLRRSVIVLPHHEDHDHEHRESLKGSGHGRPEYDEHDHGKNEHGHPPPAHPVKVFIQDLPARNGAVQVVETLLRAPMPHHEHEGHSGKVRKLMRRYLH